ncbi:LPS export ABC transporter periplasmic protein LptC [Psychromonas sp.]|nr:LPS export ABC transporter periplasmic protein LptC [Psychromonas sp.]
MNKRQSIPFLALLIGFLLWLYVKPENQVPALPDHHPSYIANEVLSNHYDEFGFNDYRISAKKVTNYPEDDLTLFEQPKILIYIKDETTKTISIWQLTSETGTLKEQKKLLLAGNVLINNLSKDQVVQTMYTEKAMLILDSKEMSSEEKVIWTGPQIRQEGVGMWASMITKEMTLNSNIEAIYFNEPK